MLPLVEIDKELPKTGLVYDLGCGQGIVAIYLSQVKSRKVVGVDQDVSRLPKTKSQNLKFESADIRKYDISSARGIVVSDVLHHINFADQKLLLKNIAKNLDKDGVLVIKEIDTRDLFRSSLSRFWDFVFYPNEEIYFNDSKRLKKSLENFGMKVEVKKTSLFFPGSTNLFICKKSA